MVHSHKFQYIQWPLHGLRLALKPKGQVLAKGMSAGTLHAAAMPLQTLVDIEFSVQPSRLP